MLVESDFKSIKFRRKKRRQLVINSINLLFSLFFFWYLFLNTSLHIDLILFLKYSVPIVLVISLLKLYSYYTHSHNLKLKNQINKIELFDDELIITNYADQKITIRKDECILIPITDQTWDLFRKRHSTSLLLTLEDGSCFYIYVELFNTHQIEDWKSTDPNKRYYTV